MRHGKHATIVKSAIVLIIVFSSVAVYAEGTKETTPTGYTEGEITYLEGDVTVDGTEAHFGSSVAPGAVVKTGGDSYCDIVFGKKNIMRVFENTLVEVNIPEGRAKLEAGALGAVFRKLSYAVTDDGSRFMISSKQVAGGIRGTSFFVKVENAQSTYLCTCFGKMRLQDAEGENQTDVEAYHHKAYRFLTEDGDIRTESAGLEYHDDETMEEIAARIDEEILWRGTAY